MIGVAMRSLCGLGAVESILPRWFGVAGEGDRLERIAGSADHDHPVIINPMPLIGAGVGRRAERKHDALSGLKIRARLGIAELGDHRGYGSGWQDC